MRVSKRVPTNTAASPLHLGTISRILLRMQNTDTHNQLNNWHDESLLPSAVLSGMQREWLTNPDSLTQRLLHFTDQKIEFSLVQQGHGNALDDEAALLGISTDQTVWTRDIIWGYQNTPWVCGHATIPEDTLAGEGIALKDIADKSIGTILFSDPDLQRDPLQFSQIDPTHPFLSHLKPQHMTPSLNLWARRSRFFCFGKPLIITEIYLPTLFQWLNSL